MRSNRKHTIDELERYILLYLEEGVSFKELSVDHGLLLTDSTFGQKVLRYQERGLSGIQTTARNNQYSKEFKETIVREYFKAGTPIKQLARKYNVPAHETVRNWIFKYTEGEEIRSYTPKPEVYTMKSRKTTQDEKMKMVKDCLENGLSYKDTAEKYQVAYNSVYQWVQKYQKHGPDGLVDGRGRRKPESIQTEEERIQAENTALKARNEYLETENAALKKLKEVERELTLRRQGTKRNTKRSRNYSKKDSK